MTAMILPVVRLAACALALASGTAAAVEIVAGTLAAPSTFSGIADPGARSAALWTEAAKVMMHPRCTNCHPVTDRPTQGEATTTRPHQPPVTRGADGFGSATLRCGSCHQKTNFDPGRMPGHEHWHLAPLSMAWQGKTAGQICQQVKDPARNGNRTIAQVVEHMSHDSLVGWAWAPGVGRVPAPGTQAELAALLDAWMATGSVCPAA